MATEFKHEHHAHNDHIAVVQLSEAYGCNTIRIVAADMRNKTVILRQITSKNKPREFSLTADEASAFVDAWTNFQFNNATYEMEEQLRKEQEELQEAERRGKVWLEVDQLAHSIPGIEIVANHSTEYNYDTGEDDPVTRWDVTLTQPNYRRYYLNSVDDVLDNVKQLVGFYNRHIQNCEATEAANFYGYNERARRETIEFLAAHRAFVEQQQQNEKEVVQAAQQQ